MAASEETDDPVPTQNNCTKREDSLVPIVEASECALPVGKENLVVGIMSATKPQAKEKVEPTYMPLVEGKNSDLLLDNGLNDHVSLVWLLYLVGMYLIIYSQSTTSPLPSKNPLDDLPKEEETQYVNNLTELVINQPSKRPENETVDTGSLTGATKFLTVEDVEQPQATNSSTMYPYFPALAGSAGESPMVWTHMHITEVCIYILMHFRNLLMIVQNNTHWYVAMLTSVIYYIHSQQLVDLVHALDEPQLILLLTQQKPKWVNSKILYYDCVPLAYLLICLCQFSKGLRR